MRRAHKVKALVDAYLKMWPREVFDIRPFPRGLWEQLEHSGVYVLYRDDQPYYVGRANRLNSRIYDHATRPKDKYYNFWNFFSAFVVRDETHIPEVEGILIAAFPTANSATPRFDQMVLPREVARLLHSRRLIPGAQGRSMTVRAVRAI